MKSILPAAVIAALSAGVSIDTGGSVKPGLYLANDSRFTETFFSEPLTTYALGFKDPNDIEATLAFLCPEVPVPRKFEWKKASNTEEFLSETIDDQRAIGSDFKRVQYQGTDVVSKTLNKGLMQVVDLDNVTGNAWEQDVVARLMRRLARNEARRAVAALSAAAVNTAKTWNSSADPDQDLRDELITATNLTGIRPNRVLFGDTSFNTRLRSYRAQDNAGGYASASASLVELAAALMVDEVYVSKERYQSSASAKTEMVSTKVISFYGDPTANTEDPSHIKRFVTLHDANQGGGRYQVHRQQLSAKTVAISVSHYSNIIVTFSTGIRQLTVAAS